MKHFFLILLTLTFFSCRKSEEKKGGYVKEEATDYVYAEGDDPTANMTPSEKMGQEIFDGKGNCFSCHKADQKVIGPSIMEIAKIYKEKNGNMVKFLKGEGDPLVDPSQYAVMKTNFSITKTFSDDELKGLEDYFYSHLK
jgi:cytochrome c